MHCIHLGPDTGETATTDLCCGSAAQAVFACSKKGKCTKQGRAAGYASCENCDVRNQPATFPTLQPLVYKEIGLPAKAKKEGAYNCSLHLDDRSGFLFAYRSKWTSSDIRIGRITDNYSAAGRLMPTIALHERAIAGREDPRLFRFRGKWHFSYTGFERGHYPYSVMYARIDQFPFVGQVFYPHYEKRSHGEKNWGFFEWQNELFAVYQIGPSLHKVLRIDGERIVEEFDSTWSPDWQWGVMRGGAPPQRVGDEFYSWFHGFGTKNGVIYYTGGLYTFEAKPPFRPLRMIKTPLVVGGYSNWEAKARAAKHIIYPCGAALKNGRWHISAGEHDNKCVVMAFDAAAVESLLEPVKAGAFTRIELNTILSLNGWCDERKAQSIANLISSIPEKVRGVEIGVFAGRSLFAAAVGCRTNPHGGHVLGIDSYDAEENLRGIHGEEHRKFWTQSLVDDAKDSVFATREKLGLAGYCKIVVSKSTDVADTVDNGLNYLHIDGNHSSEGAVLDAWLYLPKMSIGGLVLVDDTKAGGKNDFFDGVMHAVSIVERFCDLIEDHGTWRVYKRAR